MARRSVHDDEGRVPVGPLRVLSILSIAGALIGCDVKAEGAAVIQIDSAGVEIVETHRSAWSEGAEWTIATEPLLVIGDVVGDPPYLFSDIRGVVRLEDGSIIVGDGQSRELRIFDENGRFVRSVGGPGDGPSEFPQSLNSLERCGTDRLYAVDRQARRVTSFGLNGDFRRIVEFSEPGSERLPYAHRCTWDGGFIAIGWGDLNLLLSQPMPAGVEAMMYSQNAPVWVLDSLNAISLELGDLLSSERIRVRNGSSPHPFGRATKFAVSNDRIYIGTGEGISVRVIEDGALVRIQRTVTENLVLDDAMKSAYLNADSALVDSRYRNMVILAEAFPPEVPGFTELLASSSGYLWAKRFSMPGEDENCWGVFDPDGIFLGNVELPNRFSLMEVGDDYLLGVTRDDLDVERVALYSLARP